MKERLIIVGAGISGLYAAYLLQNDYDITILEARNRIGGRIFGLNELDMGPSWGWNFHHNLLNLINKFSLKTFPYHTVGNTLYDARDGVQRLQQKPVIIPFILKVV